MATTPAPKLRHQNPGNEIDEIFSSKKKPKKPDDDVTTSSKESLKPKKKISKDKPNKKKKNKLSSKGEEEVGKTKAADRPRRRTADGLAVYSAEELGIGTADAGGTPLCPFDCSCCF